MQPLERIHVLWPHMDFAEVPFFPEDVDGYASTGLQPSCLTAAPFVPGKSREQVEVLTGALYDHLSQCCCKAGPNEPKKISRKELAQPQNFF